MVPIFPLHFNVDMRSPNVGLMQTVVVKLTREPQLFNELYDRLTYYGIQLTTLLYISLLI
jgi:hypothetical protein